MTIMEDSMEIVTLAKGSGKNISIFAISHTVQKSKIKSRWIKDINLRPEIMKLLGRRNYPRY